MGSFCGKTFSPGIPPEQMGSFCVFSYSHNRIDGDYEAGMNKSCSRNPCPEGVAQRGFDILNIPQPAWAGWATVLSVEAHFVLHEAPAEWFVRLVAMGLVLY